MAGLDPVYALYASRSLGFLLHNSNLAFELDNLCLHPSHAFPPLALAIALSALAYAVSRYHLMPVPSVSLIVVGLVGLLGGGIILRF